MSHQCTYVLRVLFRGGQSLVIPYGNEDDLQDAMRFYIEQLAKPRGERLCCHVAEHTATTAKGVTAIPLSVLDLNEVIAVDRYTKFVEHTKGPSA